MEVAAARKHATMRVADFDYDLPQELIAQEPAHRRDQSRLLVLHRGDRRLEHRHFLDLPDYLRAGDCLVLNETRVIPARLLGRRAGSGGQVEVLLLEPRENAMWEALVRPGRRARPGTMVEFGEGRLVGRIIAVLDDGTRLLGFDFEGDFGALLTELGQTPLPPYIKRPPHAADQERYQTVYARQDGAVAAPTAGLHFTEELLDRIRHVGVEVAFVALHVGLGTFKPVETELVADHRMHAERFVISPAAARAMNEARLNGGRLVAVGTTVVRAVESAADQAGRVGARDGRAELFIYPGYRFRAVDALITNFHLPRSTLLMLVSAFAGRETVLMAYEEAIRRGYRFYSYGDAMLIL